MILNEHIKNPYTKNGKTLLFTCQDKRSLDILEKTGLFLNKRIYIEEHLAGISSLMLKCYDWFIKESSKRIKKPDYADYHIWCSVSAKSCMRPEEGNVAYILEVPNEEILYFSGFKWDYVLNLHYVPENEADLAAYEEDIKQKGFKNSYEFINGRYSRMFSDEEKRVRDSWLRVFDIDDWNVFDVQANIWHIKKEWVKQVIRPGERIPEHFVLD